jgi:hypothetical protein
LNSINEREPWEFTTPFGPSMRIIGEKYGKYVQFNYGNINWKSNDTQETNQNGWCSTGGELNQKMTISPRIND